MAYGNGIIKSGAPRGIFIDGYIYGTPKAGTVMQIRATALVGGSPTFEVFNQRNDGDCGPLAVLMDAPHRSISTAFAAGESCTVYFPARGEQLNMLCSSANGALAVGDLMVVDDTTGKLISRLAAVADYTTGDLDTEAELIAAINALKNRPAFCPFTMLEAVTDGDSDVLALALVN